MRKLVTKGVRESLQEEPHFANLAPYGSPEESASHHVGCGPFKRASKIMGITILVINVVVLSQRYRGPKGVRECQMEDPPLEPIWRPIVTWRRVLRTTLHPPTLWVWCLGTVSLRLKTPPYPPPLRPLRTYVVSHYKTSGRSVDVLFLANPKVRCDGAPHSRLTKQVL